MSFVSVAADQGAEETAATPAAEEAVVRPTLSQQFI
jgi:hypothetical protein